MRCYVPRIGTLVLIVAAGAGLLHGPAGHAAATVGLVTAILVATALVVGILTGMLFAVRAVQRRRGAAGACTTCRFSCQQSLTRHGARPAGRRPLLVGIYTREEPRRQWPRQPIPLTTFLNWPTPADGTDGVNAADGVGTAGPPEPTSPPEPAKLASPPEPPEPAVERLLERSAARSGDLDPGTAQHQDRARSDGDLVPS